MPLAQTIADSLAKLLDNSDRPTYVVDAGRRIVYGNSALAKWIDLPLKRIINRRVEFHS
jgi:PAS domain-containing protein